jgi:hypothetical protein
MSLLLSRKSLTCHQFSPAETLPGFRSTSTNWHEASQSHRSIRKNPLISLATANSAPDWSCLRAKASISTMI